MLYDLISVFEMLTLTSYFKKAIFLVESGNGIRSQAYWNIHNNWLEKWCKKDFQKQNQRWNEMNDQNQKMVVFVAILLVLIGPFKDVSFSTHYHSINGNAFESFP